MGELNGANWPEGSGYLPRQSPFRFCPWDSVITIGRTRAHEGHRPIRTPTFDRVPPSACAPGDRASKHAHYAEEQP
jgi:hypothetical protein